MKILTLLLLACACLPCSAACVTEACPKTAGGGAGAAGAVLNALLPVQLSVANGSRAAAVAAGRLSAELKAAFRERRAPRPAAVRAYMKLLLRLNNAWLQTPGGARVYPGEEQFAAWAAAFSREFLKYSGRMDKAHVWGPNDDAAAKSMAKAEMKKGISGLPAYRGRNLPPEPPLTPDEQAFYPGVAGGRD